MRVHICGDHTWRNGVHTDPGGCKLLCKRLAQCDHGPLGGGIGRLAARPGLAPHGGHIYDAACLTAQHRRQNGTNGMIDPLDVDVKQPVPVLGRDLADQSHVGNGGIVDQNIHRGKRINRFCNRRLVGHVAADGSCPRFGGKRSGGLLALAIEKTDPEAPRGKQPHRGRPDAPAAAGNEYVLHLILRTEKSAHTARFLSACIDGLSRHCRRRRSRRRPPYQDALWRS